MLSLAHPQQKSDSPQRVLQRLRLLTSCILQCQASWGRWAGRKKSFCCDCKMGVRGHLVCWRQNALSLLLWCKPLYRHCRGSCAGFGWKQEHAQAASFPWHLWSSTTSSSQLCCGSQAWSSFANESLQLSPRLHAGSPLHRRFSLSADAFPITVLAGLHAPKGLGKAQASTAPLPFPSLPFFL